MPLDGSDIFIIIPIHVDDGLCAMNSPPLYSWLIGALNKCFSIKDMGPASMFLGIRIERDRAAKKLWLSQKHFVLDLLAMHNMLQCTKSSVPLHAKLDKLMPMPENALPDVANDDIKALYQSLTGSYIYLAVTTRPDLAFTAMALGQFNACPNRALLSAAKGVLRYLNATADWALKYGGVYQQEKVGPDAVLRSDLALVDADWVSDERDRKSISGYGVFLYGGLVAWSSVKQKSVSLSSTESEYMGLMHVLKELLWIRMFLCLQELPIPRPFPIGSDNQASLEAASSYSSMSHMKHIDIRYHFIREHLHTDSFITHWVPTLDMTADVLIKTLAAPLHTKHCLFLGLVAR